MIKPKCPKCNSDANVVILSVGFRCTFCQKRFFKGDVVDGEHEIQTKLNCNLQEVF